MPCSIDLHELTSPGKVISTRRVTGEDCLVLDVQCSDAGRLEQVVDSLARFGPVSTALVLRDYPDKPLTPHADCKS